MGIRAIASTKMTIPAVARPTVARPALQARLDEPGWRVGTVCAPAGFGKSTVLAEWAARQIDRCVWLSCDSADREPTRFWTGLVAALTSRWPGLGDGLLAAFRQTGVETREAVVSLANDLADLAEPVVIVVDDLHLARPSPDVLAAFVNALPAPARLLIGSRHAPPFSVARRRLAGDLLELRNDDLRFSEAETESVLAVNGVTLTADEVTRLHGLTEGWPAAVQLAAMSLRRNPDRARFLDALGATDLALTDFLVNEVLEELPQDWVEFLCTTCVLDEFDADLCSHVSGRDDSGALLQELLAAGLFVVPIDDSGSWFRYHHLFGAFLRARVRMASSRRFKELNDRACAALESRGLFVAAMRLAIADRDAQRAADIVRRAFGEGLYAVDVEVSEAAARLWVYEYGERSIAEDPIQLLAVLTILMATAPADDATGWLVRIESAHPAPGPVHRGYLHADWCVHHLMRGQADEAVRHVELAMAAARELVPERVTGSRALRVRAHLDAGDVDGARLAADRGLRERLGTPAVDLVRFPAMRGWIALLDGELTRAEDLALSALTRADELGVGDLEPGRVYAGLTLAGLSSERLDDDAARAVLAEARRCAESSGQPPLRCAVALQEAMVAREHGDAAVARERLAYARALVPEASPSFLARFDLEACRQRLEFHPAAFDASTATIGDSRTARLLAARSHLQRGERATAAAIIDDVPDAVTPREHVELAVLRALVAPRISEAVDALVPVLAVAARERFVRTIVLADRGMARVLDAIPAGPWDDYVAALIKAGAAVIAPARDDPVTSLVEPLSSAELVVLRHLSSRLSNREIAEALFVSINTLKTHIKSIYRKLGVSSRADAVDAGRRLLLL